MKKVQVQSLGQIGEKTEVDARSTLLERTPSQSLYQTKSNFSLMDYLELIEVN